MDAVNELLSLASLERTKYLFNRIIDSDVWKGLVIFIHVHIFAFFISFINFPNQIIVNPFFGFVLIEIFVLILTSHFFKLFYKIVDFLKTFLK